MLSEDESTGPAGAYAASMYAGNALISTPNMTTSSDGDLLFAMSQAGGADNAWVMQAAAFKTASGPYFVGRSQDTANRPNASGSGQYRRQHAGGFILSAFASGNQQRERPPRRLLRQ